MILIFALLILFVNLAWHTLSFHGSFMDVYAFTFTFAQTRWDAFSPLFQSCCIMFRTVRTPANNNQKQEPHLSRIYRHIIGIPVHMFNGAAVLRGRLPCKIMSGLHASICMLYLCTPYIHMYIYDVAVTTCMRLSIQHRGSCEDTDVCTNACMTTCM